jgi:hypothetical protein
LASPAPAPVTGGTPSATPTPAPVTSGTPSASPAPAPAPVTSGTPAATPALAPKPTPAPVRDWADELIDQAKFETANDLPEASSDIDLSGNGPSTQPQTPNSAPASADLTDVALGSRENYAFVGLGGDWDKLTSARKAVLEQLSGNLTESEKSQLQATADLVATNIQTLQIVRAAREFGLTMARDMYKTEQIISDTWKTTKLGKTTAQKRGDQQGKDEEDIEELIASGELDPEEADGYKSRELRALEQQEQLETMLKVGGMASNGGTSTISLNT